MDEPGLRERSRARRRVAIERAAMRLFAERGYDATTIAEIATAAEVAPRTVSMYFPTKLDLALAHGDAAARRLMVMLDGAGAEPIIELLVRFVEHELFAESESRELHRAMLAANPSLRGVVTPAGEETRAKMRAKLAGELGPEPDHFVVTLVGASVEGVVGALLDLDPATQDVPAMFGVAVKLLDSWVEGARLNR